MNGSYPDPVTYVGCFSDIGRLHPEYAKPAYYVTGKAKKPQRLPLPQRLSRDVEAKSMMTKIPSSYQTYHRRLDGPLRVMESLESDRDPLPDVTRLTSAAAISRCEQLARQKGYAYFGLQNGGYCFGCDETTFQKLRPLPPEECKPCQTNCGLYGEPCGTRCRARHERGRCDSLHHQTCPHDTPVTFGQDGSRGGYFANAVYRLNDVKDQTFEYDEYNGISLRGTRFERATPPAELLVSQAQDYTYPAPQIGVQPACEDDRKKDLDFSADDNPKTEKDCKDREFELSPAQRLLPDRFTPFAQEKLALYELSAGAGKTCGATMTLSRFQEVGWRVLWVTKEKNKNTPACEMFYSVCHDKLRRWLNDPTWTFTVHSDHGQVSHTPTTRAEKRAFLKKKEFRQSLNKHLGNVELYGNHILSYNEFVSMLAAHFGHKDMSGYKGRDLLQSWMNKAPSSSDMFYRTLVVVDEAHNLRTKELDEKEQRELDRMFGQYRGRDLISEAFWHSYRVSGSESVKVLLLTATPMKSSAQELFYLLNLGQPDPAWRLPARETDDVTSYVDLDSGQVLRPVLEKFQQCAQGKVYYLEANRDASRFSRKVMSDVIDVKYPSFVRDEWEEQLKGAQGDAKAIRDVVRSFTLCVFPESHQRYAGPVATASERQRYLAWESGSRDPSKASTSERSAEARAFYRQWLPRVLAYLKLKPTPEDESKYASLVRLVTKPFDMPMLDAGWLNEAQTEVKDWSYYLKQVEQARLPPLEAKQRLEQVARDYRQERRRWAGQSR